HLFQESRIPDGYSPQYHPAHAYVKVLSDSLLVSYSSAYFHEHIDTLNDLFYRLVIDQLPVLGSVQVDHMEAVSAFRFESPRHIRRIIAVDCHLIVVSLKKSYGLSISQIYRGKNLHKYIIPP